MSVTEEYGYFPMLLYLFPRMWPTKLYVPTGVYWHKQQDGLPFQLLRSPPVFLCGKGCSVLVFMVSFVYYFRLLCLNVSLVSFVSLSFSLQTFKMFEHCFWNLKFLMLFDFWTFIIILRTRLIRVPQISLMWIKILWYDFLQ